MHQDRILRIGVIGLGVGEAHLRAYAAHGSCHIAGLCDFDEAKLQRIRTLYPQAKLVSTQAGELLTSPEIDAVSIASYDNFHHQQVLSALEHGKHVFVEKPLCLCTQEAKDIRRALKAHPDLVMSSNLVLRRVPLFVRLKNLIQEGKFGDIFYLEGDYNYGRIEKITDGWRGKLPYYSAVLGGGIHMVDLLQWLTGDRIETVQAFANRITTRSTGLQFNDFVAALCRFQQGAVGKVAANFGCVYPHFHKVSLYGSEATFETSLEGGLIFTKRDAAIRQSGDMGLERVVEADSEDDQGSVLRTFVDAILGNSPPAVTVENIFQSMSVCLAIEQSVSEGRAVSVDYI